MIFHRPTASSSSTRSLQNPAAWLLDFASGTAQTRSGVRMSESTALTYAAVFACVRVIAEAFGCLPWHLMRRVPSGTERVDDHPVAKLYRSPSDELLPQSLKETLCSYALLWGNGYAEIVRAAIGEPIALSLIEPPRVEVKRVNARTP